MSSNKNYLKQFRLLPVLYFLVSCAAVQSPSGGPKDETPPELIETRPPNGTVNFKGGRVELLFSEFINANSINKAIRVLPSLTKNPEFIYKGEKIIIEFPDSLVQNQTYIIVIDRSLIDEHNVKIEKGTQVAFSTGDKIDDGLISGNVISSKMASVNLWKIKNELDMISFYKRVPDYAIDATDNGNYEFRFLSPGKYKVVAVESSASGLILSPDRMVYGLPSRDFIQIEEGETVNNIQVKIPDNRGGSKMIKADWLNGNWGQISFSDNISKWVDKIPITIIQDDSSTSKASIYKDPLDGSKLHFILNDEVQDYVTVKTSSLTLRGRPIIESGLIRIKTDISIDTTNLSIISPTSKFILKIEADSIASLKVIFSSLVKDGSEIDPFIIKKDSTITPIDIQWESPLVARITPENNWDPNTQYRLDIIQELINPVYGRNLKDSIKTIFFKTSDYQGFGNLLISCKNEVSGLIAQVAKMEKESAHYRTVVDSSGTFIMKKIVEGNYSLFIYKDSDSNGAYSYGGIDPYNASEGFYSYPDTIKVRANWDLELDQINLGDLE